MCRMTNDQIKALNSLIQEHPAITNVKAANTVAGLVIETNKHKYDGVGLMRERYLLIAGNGRIFDGRDFAFMFDYAPKGY